MASRNEVEVTISSAKDVKNVNWRNGKTRPYAVVWVDPKNKCSTKVDEEGDTSPVWDDTLVIPLTRPVDDDTVLFIDVVHAGREEDAKPLIGSARLNLREVIDEVGLGERCSRTLKLKRPSGRPQGKLDVKVTIKEPRYHAPDPYYAPPYGVPPPASSRDYQYDQPYGVPPQNPYHQTAAPPSGYPYGGYSAPAYGQPGYAQPSYGQGPYGGQSTGYGGQSTGYGYQQEEQKKSKFGGMGTGLAVGAVGGLLGGLAIAEGVDALEDHIADEAAEKVEEDLGYDGDDF